MLKCIFSFSWQPDLAAGVADRHWREVHVPLIKAVPGTVGYVQNYKQDDVLNGPDGTAELYFENRAAWDAAQATPEWAAVNADADNFIDGRTITAVIVEEYKAF